VKERPILMNAEMVRATLEDRKTQTRRVCRPQPDCNKTSIGRPAYGEPRVLALKDGMYTVSCPYGKAGDRLWVRESVYGVDLLCGHGILVDAPYWIRVGHLPIVKDPLCNVPGFK